MNKKLFFLLTIILGAGFAGSVVATPPSDCEEIVMLKKQITKCIEELASLKLDFDGSDSSSFTQKDIDMGFDYGWGLTAAFIKRIEDDTTNIKALKAFAAKLKQSTAGGSGS